MKPSRALNTLMAITALSAVALAPSLAPEFNFQIGKVPTNVEQTVKARDLSLVCPGPVFAIGGTSGTKVTKIDRISTASAAASALLENSVTLKTEVYAASGAPAVSSNSGSGRIAQKITAANAVVFTAVDPNGESAQSPELLAASQYQVSGSGLTAAYCAHASGEHWLLSGETTVGRESLLVLTNPTSIDSSVDLKIYTDAGLLENSGLSGISVPAKGTEVVALASLMPKAQTSAIRVISHGGSIASWIQQKTTRGLAAGGIDLIPESQPEATSLVIPGLFIRGSKDAAELMANDRDYADLAPALDVFVPGSEDAEVTIQVLGADQSSFGTVVEKTVTSGRINRIELPGLADGNYSIFVSSKQPVLAQAKFNRTNKTKKPNTDFAYLPAVSQSGEARFVVVPESTVSKLSIANASEQDATVKITNVSDGSSKTVVVSKLASVNLQVSDGAVYSVSSDVKIATTLVVDKDGMLGAIALEDYRNLGGKISVSVR